MSIVDIVVAFAASVHGDSWSEGNDVSDQTKKAQHICRQWQEAVKTRYPGRFKDECSIDGERHTASQRIDLMDLEDHVAYELKSSPKNVHMEIYRDIFKVLVFNNRNPANAVDTLVFIAPEAGIKELATKFIEDVQAMMNDKHGLRIVLKEIN